MRGLLRPAALFLFLALSANLAQADAFNRADEEQAAQQQTQTCASCQERSGVFGAILDLFIRDTKNIVNFANTEKFDFSKWNSKKGKTSGKIEVSVLDPETLEANFSKLAGLSHVPFGYPEDGCYARAHEMSLILEKAGIESVKVFVEGDLRVKKRTGSETVQWWYHVAPAVVLETQNNGKNTHEVMVIDPSIFTHAVTVGEWVAKQTHHNPGQNPNIYFRPRFYYTPDTHAKDLVNWRKRDLRDTARTLKEYLGLQEALKDPAVHSRGTPGETKK